MMSIQFASSTARSWHCVLWWLVIVLTDEWTYIAQIFLCYIFDLLHIDYLICLKIDSPELGIVHMLTTLPKSCFNFQGSTFGEKHIRADRGDVLLHHENV